MGPPDSEPVDLTAEGSADLFADLYDDETGKKDVMQMSNILYDVIMT